MRLVNNNISPLPFYDDLASQNHRKNYAFGSIYPLIVPRYTLIPFQILLSGVENWNGTADIFVVQLTNFNTGQQTNISVAMREAGLSLTAYKDFVLIKYPASVPIPSISQEGRYYLRMLVMFHTGSSSHARTVYSDVFTITADTSKCLCLEYSNSYNFEFKNGFVDFSDGFQFRCYLPTEIGKPEYQFEEEVTERMGYSYVESQVSKKIYKFAFVAPEYLCDALRLVRLCENKLIKTQRDTYELTSFNMNPKWEEQGDLASVECEFETDTVIANIGGYEPVKLGDFNSDFNSDFDT